MSDGLAVLPRSFYERPVVELAEALLGQLLVRRRGGSVRVGRIVETEVYGGRGVDDSAHSFRGPTPRCAVMFGPAGHGYVYMTQGALHCMNVTAQGDREGKAVLVRAVEPVRGAGLMLRRRLERLDDGPTRRRLERLAHGGALRRLDRPTGGALSDGQRAPATVGVRHERLVHELAQGPGRLCLAFDIDRRLDGVDLTDAGAPLVIAAGEPVAEVRWTPRIGLNPAAFSHRWRWRALDAGSPAVSRRTVFAVRWRQPRPGVCPAAPGGTGGTWPAPRAPTAETPPARLSQCAPDVPALARQRRRAPRRAR